MTYPHDIPVSVDFRFQSQRLPDPHVRLRCAEAHVQDLWLRLRRWEPGFGKNDRLHRIGMFFVSGKYMES